MSRRKDLFIQLSRIIACLGVCGVHIGYGYEVKGIGGVLSVGRYGLFVFFVLSGFLACMWNGEDRRTYIKKKSYGWLQYITCRLFSVMSFTD